MIEDKGRFMSKKLMLFLLFIAVTSRGGSLHAEPERSVEKSIVTNQNLPDKDAKAVTEIERFELRSDPAQIALSVNPELVDKLSAEQLENVLRFAIRHRNPPPETLLKEDILIPFIVFASLVFIVLLALYFPYRKAKDMQETLRVMIKEKHEIPEAYFAAMNRRSVPTEVADLRKGVLLLALGIAAMGLIFLANPNSSQDGSWSVGFIPLCLGLAYLLLWQTRRRSGAENSHEGV